MFLKRLESVGFKSFAERIKIDFVPGVTAVVGPNGSGKSNVTDAIRWVLGETSAKSIRGSSMEDIIFQGSETRNPLNVAEVTLILDNAEQALPIDYEEVSVTRRVYRSGESEFYLNKQVCRLKDITDLFMDSGLGKEAFSIISQGKVEEILNSKADDRRTIFEEAAGVLKYKQRKKKAESKLDETQDNLNRIEDIIYEIEQQIGPLKEQSDIAHEYLRQKENLEHKEIALLVTEIEQLYADWENILTGLEKEREQANTKKTAIQKREADLEKEAQALKQADDSIETLQTKLLDLTKELEASEGKKDLLKERLKHFTENKESLKAAKTDIQERIDTVREQWKKEKDALIALKEKKQSTSDHIHDLETKQQTSEKNLSEQIEELKSAYIELLNEQAAKRNEQQSIENQLEALASKKSNIQKTHTDLIRKRDELDKEKADLEQKISKLEKDYHEKERDIKKQNETIDEKRTSYHSEQEKVYKAYQSIEKLKSQEEMLEGLKEDFQGFYHGVKEILKARDDKKLSRIHGAVIELIDVPDQYVTAIDTVLGGASQNIAVDDEQSARRAISWLKKTSSGRATFLPLSSIKPRFVRQDVLSRAGEHNGFIGVAADLVSTRDIYRPAADHLMGHVLIADSLQDANEIANMTHYKHRIVTLEGDVINPSGSMSGGAKKKVNQSLFTREKDLKAITKKRKAYEQRTHQLEQKVNNLSKEIDENEAEREKLAERMEEQRQTLQSVQTGYKECDMKLTSIKDNMSLYSQDNLQFDEDRDALNRKKQLLADELITLKEQLNEKNERMETLSRKQSTFEEDQEKLQHEMHQYQVTLAEQDERVRSQEEKTSTLKNQLDELKKQYADNETRWQQLMDTHENEQTEDEVNERITEQTNDKENMTTNIQQKRKERLEKSQRMQDEEREVKEETKQHQRFLKAIQEKEVQANRLDVALDNRLKKLESDYTLTYEKAKKTYEKVSDTESAEADVKQIKEAIEQLGNVHTGAIDEYKRIYERYSFLEGQKNDLDDAKATLYKVINEMDEEMQVRFEATFTQIKEAFAVVFTELFGGGRAELNLTDPNRLLDTGVEIIAQPPGKKLQHLGLLSGGERALTAIALLFAILRVRPVPFCVLDETESALDEANVIRFRDYVKMHSNYTQFIVITHRQRTMEGADVLYGITMQESGVSRLVSVRLEDTKELVNT